MSAREGRISPPSGGADGGQRCPTYRNDVASMRMNMKIQQLEEQLLKDGLVSHGDLCGCSPQEVREVETVFGVTLPGFYARFLQKMGRNAGSFLKGSSVFYPELFKLRGYVEELLRETGAEFRLSERDFVFYVHQGYQFAYFQVDAGDDPPVWCFEEGWEAPIEKWASLSAFLLAVACDERVRS